MKRVFNNNIYATQIRTTDNKKLDLLAEDDGHVIEQHPAGRWLTVTGDAEGNDIVTIEDAKARAAFHRKLYVDVGQVVEVRIVLVSNNYKVVKE